MVFHCINNTEIILLKNGNVEREISKNTFVCVPLANGIPYNER